MKKIYFLLIFSVVFFACKKKSDPGNKIEGLGELEIVQINDTVKKVITIRSETLDSTVKFLFVGLTDNIITEVKAIDINSGQYEVTLISTIQLLPDGTYSILLPNEVLKAKIICTTTNETLEKSFTVKVKPHYIASKNGYYKQDLSCFGVDSVSKVQFTTFIHRDSSGYFQLSKVYVGGEYVVLRGNFAANAMDNSLFVNGTHYSNGEYIIAYGTYSDSLIVLNLSHLAQKECSVINLRR